MVFAPWDALPQRHKTTDLVRAKITFFLTQVVILDKCSFLWSARLGQSLIKCLPFSSHTTHGSKNYGSEGAVFHIQYALVVLTPSLSSWKGQLHLWFISSESISSNRTGCNWIGVSVSRTSSGGSIPSGCFCFRSFNVLLSSGRIPFSMLLVKSLIAPLMLLFDIFSMNRFEISLVFIVFWEELGWFWIVLPSGSRYFISPRCQRSIHRELRGGLWILRCEMVSATGVLTLP